ncbi:MAG: Mur ligase family protein [Patescibacteria group bacterium]
MKSFLKKLLPEPLVLAYHYLVAWFGALYFGFPGKKMMVIGVTGTKGKTTTSNFIWAVLTAGGHKTGIISTANIRIGGESSLNYYHMTMPGRFAVQRLMAKMAKAGCTHCVVETTSEGLKQYRHIGVYYDIGVFTNLTPEHLPSHGGSFENYKHAKGKMFAHTKELIIANGDDPHAEYFLSFPAKKKIKFHKSDFDATRFHLGILGDFNIANALPAIIIGRELGISDADIAKGLADLKLIPGRMEIIQYEPFVVIVDYAHEKMSITNVLETAKKIRKPGAKTIILLGAEGGGRDKRKRPIMGELAAKLADYLICSNVDPYDDDPTPIVEDIAVAAEAHGMVRNQNLFVIEDRRLGIRKALELAQPGDVVLITGKGSEQSMIIDGKSIPWDDRVVVREEIHRLHPPNSHQAHSYPV